VRLVPLCPQSSTNTRLDQDAVIKALKQQVADLQSRTSELTSLNKSISALTKTNTTLTAENKKLADSLNTAQKENTTLNTKLAAARSSTQAESKIPGSAVKPRTTGVAAWQRGSSQGRDAAEAESRDVLRPYKSGNRGREEERRR
jgi:regulator of replication initiation timing